MNEKWKPGVVPKRIPEPLHFGRREIIVLILGVVATTVAAFVLLESSATDKRVIIGVPVAVAVLFVLLAFYRDRAHGAPFEERFLRIYRFYRRERYLVKGASSSNQRRLKDYRPAMDALDWIAVAAVVVSVVIYILSRVSLGT